MSLITNDEPAFYRLSEELLTIIVDYIVAPESGPNGTTRLPFGTIENLKNLRLVHRRLGYLKRIEAELFAKIWLNRALWKSNDAVISLQRVASLVREVEFGQPKRKTSAFRTSWKDSGPCLDYDMGQVWKDKAGHTTQLCTDETETKERWTRLLRLFTNLETIVIRPQDWQGGMNSTGNWKAITFDLVLHCISVSKVRPRSLEISYNSTCHEWSNTPLYEIVDLTRLKTLNLSTETPLDQECLSAIFERCAASIQSIIINDMRRIYQDRPEFLSLPTMPQLRKLELKSVNFAPRTWSDWIIKCPRLQRLRGWLTIEAEESFEEWKPFFTALRNHPRTIHVRLGGLLEDPEGYDVTIDQDTAQTLRPSLIDDEDLEDAQDPGDAHYQRIALEAYISGREDYREWLPW